VNVVSDNGRTSLGIICNYCFRFGVDKHRTLWALECLALPWHPLNNGKILIAIERDSRGEIYIISQPETSPKLEGNVMAKSRSGKKLPKNVLRKSIKELKLSKREQLEKETNAIADAMFNDDD
jgi:hypothetical protein